MIRNNRKESYIIPEALLHTGEDLERIAKGDISRIKDTVYKGTKVINGEKTHSVRDALSDLYFKKCAYCEDDECKPEVEHYRPKKAVKEEPTHRGYYWLCYEWTNLLPSCRYCNTEGGKGNQFPIQGKRVFQPTFSKEVFLDKNCCQLTHVSLSAELPYLLNPEADDPSQFFQVEKDGTLKGIDAEGRGEMTIKICNLKRGNLVIKRKRMIDDWVADINKAFLLFEDTPNTPLLEKRLLQILEEMSSASQPESPFSLVAIQSWTRFAELIASQLPKSYQPILIELHKFYSKN